MLSLRIPVKVSFTWAEDPARIVSANLMVATWLSLLIEISGLEVTTEPWAKTVAPWMSISLVLREIEVVSSTTWRLH
jgi:hypothetical protein